MTPSPHPKLLRLQHCGGGVASISRPSEASDEATASKKRMRPTLDRRLQWGSLIPSCRRVAVLATLRQGAIMDSRCMRSKSLPPRPGLQVSQQEGGLFPFPYVESPRSPEDAEKTSDSSRERDHASSRALVFRECPYCARAARSWVAMGHPINETNRPTDRPTDRRCFFDARVASGVVGCIP